MFEKYFSEDMNRNLSYENVPEEIITPEIVTEGEEYKAKELAPKITHHLMDPAISGIMRDEAITFIDASQIESSLLAASQNYRMPIDPAIVSYTAAHQYKNQ